MHAVAVGALPDGAPVIVSGGDDRTVRVWRLADGTPVGDPLTGHAGPVHAVAVGALPDGTPVIISGGDDRTVRVWRLADGTPVGDPLTGHTGAVRAVAVGALPDGRGSRLRCYTDLDARGQGISFRCARMAVIVSGDHNNMVRVWRLADGTPVGDPLTGHGGPRCTRWRWGRCRTAPRSSSAAATTATGGGVAAGRRHRGRGPAHNRPYQ